jgi:hypothetical protein
VNCFPQRWKQEDDSDFKLLEAALDYLQTKRRASITSAFELTFLVTQFCCKDIDQCKGNEAAGMKLLEIFGHEVNRLVRAFSFQYHNKM